MSAFLLRSVSLYEKVLRLYPADLRRDFGAEMALAFAEDLEAAWGDARVAGVLQIWWYAFRELLTVALPAQTANPCVLVPLLAFTVVAATQSAELWLSLYRVARVDASLLLDGIRFIVLLPSFLAAGVALIVHRVYAGLSITVLRLE
jgi:hypothetical protein